METAFLEKQLRKGRLKAAYFALPNEDVRQDVLSRYGMLKKENPQSDKMLARHMENAILPAIALRDILPRHGYTKGECLRLIRGAVLNTAKPMQRVFRTAGHLPFFFNLLRVMCKKSMPAMFGEGGWVFEWKTDTKEAIEWDCSVCIYQDVFVRYGMPELTAIFCESDDVMYGNIPGVRWGRTKTIGRGDEICDFCFYKE